MALSGTGRDSQFAFYAADVGAECALYWDLKHHVFVIPTAENGAPDQFTIRCSGASPTVVFAPPNKFIFALLSPQANVTFERLAGGGGRITARGYSGQAGRRVERGLEVTY